MTKIIHNWFKNWSSLLYGSGSSRYFSI